MQAILYQTDCLSIEPFWVPLAAFPVRPRVIASSLFCCWWMSTSWPNAPMASLGKTKVVANLRLVLSPESAVALVWVYGPMSHSYNTCFLRHGIPMHLWIVRYDTDALFIGVYLHPVQPRMLENKQTMSQHRNIWCGCRPKSTET